MEGSVCVQALGVLFSFAQCNGGVSSRLLSC